ncbi:PIN domain-containing protein [Desulfonatronum thioautotrophicum]|uniref:PIN domain-containing protein n=1 Tax=Desulfonatronum thioautotrophicum TaxID=617001 RepID=UPI0005EB11F2|nr:PIN domain-containing protein [Desulfonatronum thioautotrophicum]
MRSFFDTNVLVYMFDRDAPAKRTLARELFQAETLAGRTIVSAQVMQEFYVTVTRKLARPLDEQTAAEIVNGLASLPVIANDAALILKGISRSRYMHLSFWDAMIIEAALSGGAKTLFTEDLQHDQVIDGMRLHNPFMI